MWTILNANGIKSKNHHTSVASHSLLLLDMDDRIEKVLNHLEGKLTERYTLDDLAKIACLSPSHFHRLFKKETHATPAKFIEQMKMAKAYHCLMNEDIMIRQLADGLGYQDYETFSRVFKKYYDLAPDDLKSIVIAVKDRVPHGENSRILVTTTDQMDEEDGFITDILKMAKENNIDKSQLDHIQIFKIDQKKSDATKSPDLIKNKYEITKGDKIWKTLLHKLNS